MNPIYDFVVFLFPVEKPGEKTTNEWLIKENTFNKLFLAKFIKGIYCPIMMVNQLIGKLFFVTFCLQTLLALLASLQFPQVLCLSQICNQILLERAGSSFPLLIDMKFWGSGIASEVTLREW